MLDISRATSTQQLAAARSLFRAFLAWHRRQHADDIELIDRYFDEAAFEAELAGLPGKYAPPKGSLRLAYVDGQPVGCVALRDLGEGVCEMKRMFVPTSFRGSGVGRALANTVIDDARAAGYGLMRLDTSMRQDAAMRLYESMGFRRIEPYYDLPAELRGWLVFFERKL